MNNLPKIELFDIFLALGLLSFIYILVFRFRKKNELQKPLFNLFIIALSAKVIGAITFVFISLFYYKNGDTFLYFQIAEDLRNNLFVNYSETVRTLFTPYSELSNINFNPLEKYNYYFERETSWIFGRIVFFFNLISFGSYLVCSILMAVVSFLGLWLGYIAMCKLYRNTNKLMLIPFFLIPTALIWSSGILKDTLIIGLVGLFLYSFSNIFIFRNNILFSIVSIIVGVYLLQFLKPILLIILIPYLFFWGFLYLTKPIKDLLIKVTFRFLVVVLIIGGGYFINQICLDSSSKYRIENALQTVKGIQSFHSMDVFSEGQNSYTLGGYTTTPQVIIKKIPEAINVTFFRPYLWEINNWPMLLGAIESLLLFVAFIYVLVVAKKHFFRAMITNYEVIFMLFFSFTYSAVIGVSSYNFGALSRYKIPAIMFCSLVLIILCNQTNKVSKSGGKIKD
ncbi:MAG: hypothetical protein JKX68_01385 [Flavobacteriales bacterium]|nr:hypothetical protein [Flavobacteriales bacterium]